MFKTNWRKLHLLQQSISRAMSAMGNQEVFNEILLGERKIVDLELIYSQQGPYVPSSKSKVVPDHKRTFLGDALASQGEATLTFSDQSTLRVDYRHLGRGKHRDCLKFWQGPNESESKAIVAKIVPSAPDGGSIQDFQFLTECERAGVQVANLPKALACFESDRTMFQIMRRPCRATVLFTTLSGQGITITDVVTNGKLQTGYEKNKFWLQYCSWASNVLQESIQRLGGIYTDCHFSNIVLLKWPVRQANNFEFSLVDASGLLQFGFGKNGTQKARKAVTYWLEHCAFDIDHQYKQRMLPVADDIRDGESSQPFSNTWASRDILTTALQNFGNVAQQCLADLQRQHAPDVQRPVRERAQNWPPLSSTSSTGLANVVALQHMAVPADPWDAWAEQIADEAQERQQCVQKQTRWRNPPRRDAGFPVSDPSFVPIGDMSQGSVPTKSESAGFPVHSTETGFPVMEHSFVPIGGTAPMAALPRHCSSGTGFPVMDEDKSQGSGPTRSAEFSGLPLLGLNNNAPERSIDEESLDQGFHPWSLKSEVKTEQMPQLPGMECPAIDYDPDDEADDDEAVLKKFQTYLPKIQQSIPDGDVDKTENEWFVRIDMQQPHGKKIENCVLRVDRLSFLMVVGVMKSFVVAITLVMTKLHQEGFVGNGGLQRFRMVVKPVDYWRRRDKIRTFVNLLKQHNDHIASRLNDAYGDSVETILQNLRDWYPLQSLRDVLLEILEYSTETVWESHKKAWLQHTLWHDVLQYYQASVQRKFLASIAEFVLDCWREQQEWILTELKRRAWPEKKIPEYEKQDLEFDFSCKEQLLLAMEFSNTSVWQQKFRPLMFFEEYQVARQKWSKPLCPHVARFLDQQKDDHCNKWQPSWQWHW